MLIGVETDWRETIPSYQMPFKCKELHNEANKKSVIVTNRSHYTQLV